MLYIRFRPNTSDTAPPFSAADPDSGATARIQYTQEMHRRQFLTLLAAAPTARAQPRSFPPNILLLIFDKCRADALGCYGFRRAHTENLDSLAASGVRFDHAYT